jgi:D-glycero-alpha-D-manno-heptose-7-phosphate kinase
MILSKTPVRITFFGGGSDYPCYFSKAKGKTLSLAINKYSYIAINRNLEVLNSKFILNYRQIEKVKKISLIKHPSIKACLNYKNIKDPIQINYFGDLPAKTGLGSSSSFTVGLLNCLKAIKKEKKSSFQIAKEAIYVEQKIIKERVGCQDQLTCGMGGLLHITYVKNKDFYIKKNFLEKEKIKKLCSYLMLFYTGIDRYSDNVLKEQIKRTKLGHNSEIIKDMVDMVDPAVDSLIKENYYDFGIMLDQSWNLKKKLSNSITNKKIDNYYSIGKKSGAIGGKLLGAGGGGFLMFFVPHKSQKLLLKNLRNLRNIRFSPDFLGTRIIK